MIPPEGQIPRGAVIVAVLGALLAGCTAEPEHAALKDARLPPLILAYQFAYRPTTTAGYQLSPDGRRLSWYGSHFGRNMLHVRDNATGTVRRFRVGGGVQWTPDGKRLLYTADTSGAENPHVYMIEPDGPNGKPVDLTPWDGVRAGIHQVPAGEPARVLVFHNRRDRRVFDLYRIDLATRRETLIAQNPGDAMAPITAADGSFKGWRTSRAAQRRATDAPKPLAARKPGLVKAPDETFQSLGLSADGSVVWAISNRGRDRLALVAADPRLGWERVVFEDPDVDVLSVTMSHVTRAPLVARAYPGYPRVEILDPQLREDLAALLNAHSGSPYDLDIVSTESDEKRMIVAIGSDSQRRTYLVDREARSHVLLAELPARDLAAALAPMRPVTIPSRDGLRLHGYLTLPRGTQGKRLPMVLHVHGGPWLRTAWGDPVSSDDAGYAQFLANRGYAVLQVDFRGSTGYGRSFSMAGMEEFAGRMQEDLLDAVRWAVDGGIADPARVAIMGWSYGGYAALTGLAMTPEVFACGVSIAGPTDLASLIESFPPYWTPDLSLWHDFVGDPAIAEDREEMKQKSPLYHADKVQRPVLIVHGVRDVRVRVDQSDSMVAALKRAGKAVEYLRIPDMGHGPGWWPHRIDVLRKTETFLRGCLGGRAVRIDWFEPLAWAWTQWSRFRESAGAPATRPAGKEQAAHKEDRNETTDERR
jgi:dipeptidyl aminopeptidase/acylaminoacyl peptidase